MAWVFVGTTADGRDHWQDTQASADCWLELDGKVTVKFKPMNDAEVEAAVTASTNVAVNELEPNFYQCVDESGSVTTIVDARGRDIVAVEYMPIKGLTREERKINLEQTLRLR